MPPINTQKPVTAWNWLLCVNKRAYLRPMTRILKINGKGDFIKTTLANLIEQNY